MQLTEILKKFEYKKKQLLSTERLAIPYLIACIVRYYFYEKKMFPLLNKVFELKSRASSFIDTMCPR